MGRECGSYIRKQLEPKRSPYDFPAAMSTVSVLRVARIPPVADSSLSQNQFLREYKLVLVGGGGQCPPLAFPPDTCFRERSSDRCSPSGFLCAQEWANPL